MTEFLPPLEKLDRAVEARDERLCKISFAIGAPATLIAWIVLIYSLVVR